MHRNSNSTLFYEEEDFPMDIEDSTEKPNDGSYGAKWESMEENVLFSIFEYFDIVSLLRASRVCKKWNLLTRKIDVIDLSKVGHKVQDEVVSFVAMKWPHVKVLNLLGSKISANGLQYLNGLTKLEKLVLWGCESLIDGSLKYLLPLQNLVDLDLCCCRRISDLSISNFSSFQKLERLDFGSCVKVTDVGMKHITVLTNLRYLNLSRLEITDISLGYLANLPLKSLNLSYCDNFTMTKLVTLNQLEDLSLVYSKQVTDASLKTLCATMTNLRRLDLWGCKNTTEAILPILLNSTLQFVDITYCPISEIALRTAFAQKNNSKIKIKLFHQIRSA